MSQIFEKNLKALTQKNPTLAAEIFGITKTDFDVYIQGNDNANLNFIDKKNALALYETQPIKEIENDLKTFEKEYIKYPVLFFYGLGNGILVKLLARDDRKIIVIEPNPQIIYLVFNLIDLSEEIENEKIIFLSQKHLNFPVIYSLVKNPDILMFVKTYKLHIQTPYYEKLYKNDILNINHIFANAIKQAVIDFGNDTEDTLIGIKHSILNTPEMLKNPPVQSLKDKKNSDIAVIVSTGPSLTKQLPLLKEVQNKITIIAVDASMPILEKWGIIPDFVTSLERVEATAKFFKETSPEFQKKFITIHASLQHEEVLKNSYGERILSMRAFLYNRYLELDRYGYLGIGMSAANMAYELAFLLGFKEIVLIGQDLAYAEDGKSHASGHVYGENEVKFKDSDLFVTKYGGNGTVRTSKMWNMFKNHFERDIFNLNEKGIKTYNATEGGARIEGSIEIPFKEIVQKLNNTSKSKISITPYTNEKYKEELLHVYNKLLHMIKEGQKTQKEIEKVFLKVAEEFENLIYLNQNNKLEEINFEHLLDLIKEIDKIKEKLEDEEFIKMYGESVSSYLINKETDLAKIQVKNATTDIEKKAKIIDWIMNHKDWLFMLAGILHTQIEVVKSSLHNITSELDKLQLPYEKIKED